ncbi:MAG: methyltransferase domain-containing protein, partial [Sphingomicrobium sp.]
LRYSSLGDLVRDLRAMGATGVLAERPPPLSKAAARRAAEAFGQAGSGGRTEELVEILHFLGWSQFSKQAAG